jgi:CBS domain-containing protein
MSDLAPRSKESVMKVKELMAREVRICRVEDSLNRAAQLMWEGDCGVLPVVGAGGTVVGMITDKDICMAAYTRGGPVESLRVGDAMAKQVSSCSPEATLEAAMSLMKETHVRRLPVLDSQVKLVGILSLNDLAREARRRGRPGERQAMSADLADMLGIVCEPRQQGVTASKSQAKRVGELVGVGD